MKGTLLTVSGTIPADIEAQIAQGQRPLADYIAMARGFPAERIDYAEAARRSGWFGKLLKKVGGPNLLLAWACFRQRGSYQAIFSDGEQVGIPYALLEKFLGWGRRPRHLMIGHILSVPKKMLLVDRLKLHRQVDIFLVYSTWQKAFIEQRWKIAPERVIFTPFMVDANFFSPTAPVEPLALKENPAGLPLICSVGLERRDYPTLLKAVEGLDVFAVIAAASPWSKQTDNTQGRTLPANVLVQRYSQFELRRVYAASRFMVMPLQNVEFQAGITAILEAMAMGKAVICTHTPGQTDAIEEGVTGLYVPPEDPTALRQAIEYLLDHPAEAERMGQNGRARVLKEMSLDCYVTRLKQFLPPD